VSIETTGRSTDAIQAVVDVGGPQVLRLLGQVERRMAELADGSGALLAQHAGETIAAGGKRLRPLLVCLAAGAPPPETEAVLHAAVAVELVHGATLVHDDVLDGSRLRRGRPTVFARGGRRLATATGDLLFSRAFAELAAGDSMEAVRILSRAACELAAGELMQRSDAFDGEVTVERYLERSRLKTGVLFRAACELGALAAAGPAEELGAFGERVGVAFQILDDILDITGPPERTGKPQGADLLDGTLTLPVILARAADPRLAGVELHDVRTSAHAAELCDLIALTGALEDAKLRALELVAQATRSLPELPGRQRIALELVAEGVVQRYA
jgi:geranylgeranyl pyrophosphate synthase